MVIGVDNGVMPVEQMQVTITKPIEDAVNSVPGLVTVRSNTSRGSAEVSLFFDWSVDMFRTLQLVDAALGRVQQSLPATAKLTTNRLTFATFPILGYSLTSDVLSQTQLWELANYTLKPSLNRVAGVSTVTIQGGAVPEFHIVPNMAKLQAAGVTILDVTNAIQVSNIIDSPGLYQRDHQLVLALVGAQAHDVDGLKQLTVKTSAGGAAIRVGDLAEVIPATMPVYTAVRADGRPAVLLNVTRQPSSNTVTVANDVAAQVAQLRTKLPRGVSLKPYYDPVGDRAGERAECARCDRDRAGAGVRDSVSVSARLAGFADCRAGDPGDGCGDGAGAVADGRELQPDDAGWAGGGDRAGDR